LALRNRRTDVRDLSANRPEVLLAHRLFVVRIALRFRDRVARFLSFRRCGELSLEAPLLSFEHEEHRIAGRS
jgi:hypothetical protein